MSGVLTCKAVKKLVSFVIGFILVSSCVWGATLDEVLSKINSVAQKSKDQVKSLKILAETQIKNGNDLIETNVVVYQKGDKIRSEVKAKDKNSPYADALNAVVIMNGKDVWFISPVMGTQKLPPGQLSPGASSMQGINDTKWINNLKKNMEFVGEEPVNGVDCYVLSVSEPTPMKIYIAKDGGYWVKIEQAGPTGEKIEVMRSGFKEIAPGVKLGYRTEMKTNGEVFSTTIIKDVNVNIDVPDSLFIVKQTPVDKAAKAKTPDQKSEWDALEKLKQ